jgi:quercetin dioxygenase-like cupin family protein
MADRVEFSDGTVWVFASSAEDPDRDPVVIDFYMPDGAQAPPPHYHPNGQRETFEVLKGSFEVKLDGKWQTVNEGETAVVEPGVIHTFRNKSGAEVVLRNVHTPAYSFERYMRRIHAIATERKLEKLTPVGMIAMARLWSEHPDTMRPGPPPLRIAMPALAALGRATGVTIPD